VSRTKRVEALRQGIRIDLLLLAAATGVLVGGFGAVTYYSDLLRPLAHVLGPWILLAAVLSARQLPAMAVVRSTVSLVAAVVAFYVGKDVMYTIEYGDAPYSVNIEQLLMWIAFAVVGGIALASLTSCCWPSSGWRSRSCCGSPTGVATSC
jgi:hypothetical protein